MKHPSVPLDRSIRRGGIVATVILLLGALCAPTRAQGLERALEPDLEAAVGSIQKRFERAVLGTPRGRSGALLVEPCTTKGDPLRSLTAARELVDRLALRGADVVLYRPEGSEEAEAPAEARFHVKLGVVHEGDHYALWLRGNESGDLEPPLRVEFVEKPWVRGALPVGPRFAAVVRGTGSGADGAAALRAARGRAAERVQELIGADHPLPRELVLERLPAWELDRFQSAASPEGHGAAAVLLGIDSEGLDRLKLAHAKLRRAEITSWLLKSGGGLLWMALCIFSFLRLDLATRGYLSLPLGGLFSLAGLGGILALLAWA